MIPLSGHMRCALPCKLTPLHRDRIQCTSPHPSCIFHGKVAGIKLRHFYQFFGDKIPRIINVWASILDVVAIISLRNRVRQNRNFISIHHDFLFDNIAINRRRYNRDFVANSCDEIAICHDFLSDNIALIRYRKNLRLRLLLLEHRKLCSFRGTVIIFSPRVCILILWDQ